MAAVYQLATVNALKGFSNKILHFITFGTIVLFISAIGLTNIQGDLMIIKEKMTIFVFTNIMSDISAFAFMTATFLLGLKNISRAPLNKRPKMEEQTLIKENN